MTWQLVTSLRPRDATATPANKRTTAWADGLRQMARFSPEGDNLSGTLRSSHTLLLRRLLPPPCALRHYRRTGAGPACRAHTASRADVGLSFRAIHIASWKGRTLRTRIRHTFTIAYRRDAYLLRSHFSLQPLAAASLM